MTGTHTVVHGEYGYCCEGNVSDTWNIGIIGTCVDPVEVTWDTDGPDDSVKDQPVDCGGCGSRGAGGFLPGLLLLWGKRARRR